jgi:hypothetical protein
VYLLEAERTQVSGEFSLDAGFKLVLVKHVSPISVGAGLKELLSVNTI